MKKLYLLMMSFTTALNIYAQDTTATKIYHNEFGIDATGFFRQFLHLDASQFPEGYIPAYYLTYRRHFNCGNIRAAVGGSYSKADLGPGYSFPSNKFFDLSYSYNARVGWEFINSLSRRWQAFYGMDFRSEFSHLKNDIQYMNGGYANGYEEKSMVYGLAPTLGIKFKINKRINLSTETSFAFNYGVNSGKKYYYPSSSQYPAMPDIILPKTKSIYTLFAQPISVYFAFNI